MSSGSPVESVRRAFALLEELNRQRINIICTRQPLFRSRPSYACWRLFSAPRLRGERSTTGRIPGDLRGARAKLRLLW